MTWINRIRRENNRAVDIKRRGLTVPWEKVLVTEVPPVCPEQTPEGLKAELSSIFAPFMPV